LFGIPVFDLDLGIAELSAPRHEEIPLLVEDGPDSGREGPFGSPIAEHTVLEE
jgi:hypothetical protein